MDVRGLEPGRLRSVAFTQSPERRCFESVARLADIVFDCERPASLARWWASTLDGYRVAPYDSAELERLRDMGVFDLEDDPSVVVEPAPGAGPRYLFMRVPEPKRHKNRLHLDLRSDDLEAEVRRLVDRGAVELSRIDTNVTMADPRATSSASTRGRCDSCVRSAWGYQSPCSFSSVPKWTSRY